MIRILAALILAAAASAAPAVAAVAAAVDVTPLTGQGGIETLVDVSEPRVAALDRAVTVQAEVVQTERVALEAGVGTQTDYLSAEADLLDARSDLQRAHYGLMAAHVEMARVSGALDEAWVTGTLQDRRL